MRCTVCESTSELASSFVSKSENPQRKRINYCSKLTVKMQRAVQKCLTGSVDLKRVETPMKATPRSGRPSTSRNEEMIAEVRTNVRNNRRLTVRQVADDCGISVGSCDAILNENDRKNGGMATGSRTTTMHPHTLHILCSRFWPNTAPLSCSSHHTHRISHRVTFSYSQGLRRF